MAAHSNYQRSTIRSFPSLASTDHGQMFTRDMGPSSTDFLPQPVEIDLNLARTLPNPGIPALMPLEFAFPSQGLGGMPYGRSGIPRMPINPSEGQMSGIVGAPLASWYTANDGPWNPYQNPGTESVVDDRSFPRHTTNRNLPYASQYRQSNTANAIGFTSGITPSDSGYATQRSIGNTSVFSADIQDRDQDGNSMAPPSPEYPVFSGYNEVLQQHDHRSPGSWSPQTTHPSGPPGLICPTCHKSVKTQSELKKHDLRHRKPFVCKVPHCSRGEEGFSTTNDLDRHTRSKHPAVQENSSARRYRCHVPGCKSKDKAWPRLDNFRSHLKRVHENYLRSEEAFDEMVRRAEFWDKMSHTTDREVISVQNSFPVIRTALPVQERLPSHGVDHSHTSQYPDLSEDSMAYVESQDNTYGSKDSSPKEQYPQSEELVRTTVQPVEVLVKAPAQIPESRMTLGSLLSTNIDPSLKDADASTRLQARNSTQGKVSMPATTATDATLTDVIQKALAGAKLSDISVRQLQKQDRERSSLPNGKISRQDSSTSSIVKPSSREQVAVKAFDGPSEDCTKDAEGQRKAQEVLKHIRDLGYTVTKDPSRSPKGQNPGSAASKRSEHKVTCPKCQRFEGRPCELRKHMKRHNRPYGCTFLTCNKEFGSKNDWKRHENSQHFHLEAWRCNEERAEGGLCAKSFYRRQTFQEHLKKEYRITDKGALDEKFKACGIGRNCQSQFWCGFCKKLVDLEKQGLAAWNERFDHIDKHFMGKAPFSLQTIRDWSPVDTDLSRADFVLPFPLGFESGSGSLPSDGNEGSSSDSGSSRESESHSSNSPKETQADPPRKKRPAVDEAPATRPAKQVRRHKDYETRVYCCQCHEPYTLKYFQSCPTCPDNHKFCDTCPTEAVDIADSMPTVAKI